jgi:hypothetical protein
MLAREMQISFMRELSTINQEFEYPNIVDSDTIFYFVNLAQDRYLKENYISRESVKDNNEFLQKKIDDLKQLISRKILFTDIINSTEPTIAITTSSLYSTEIKSSADGALLFPLPTDYIYYIRSSSKLSGTYLNLNTKTWVENKLIDHSDISNSILINGLNTPIIRNPYILLEKSPTGTTLSKSYMVLYKDSYSNLFNIEITYIRKPRQIILTVSDANTQTNECELAISTHQEIVSYAVKMFVEEYKYKLSNNHERGKQ